MREIEVRELPDIKTPTIDFVMELFNLYDAEYGPEKQPRRIVAHPRAMRAFRIEIDQIMPYSIVPQQYGRTEVRGDPMDPSSRSYYKWTIEEWQSPVGILELHTDHTLPTHGIYLDWATEASKVTR